MKDACGYELDVGDIVLYSRHHSNKLRKGRISGLGPENHVRIIDLQKDSSTFREGSEVCLVRTHTSTSVDFL